MACAVFPPGLRCFRHILHVYARNLPLNVTGEGVREFSGGAGERDSRKLCVSSYFVISSAPFAATSGVMKDSSEQRVTDIPLAEEDRFIYISEVQCGTQHPVWHHIPESVRLKFARVTRFVFSLYYCTADPANLKAAPDTDLLLFEMLVDTSHVQYLAPSVTLADELPQLPCHVDYGTSSLVVLLRCTDGVFFPLHQGMQPADGEPKELHGAGSMMTTLAAGGSLATPSSSLNESRNDVLLRRIDGVKSVTVGDLKTCATGTLSWLYLSDLSMARREAQEQLMNEVSVWSGEVANTQGIDAQRAVLETRLANACERQNQQLSLLEKLRKDYLVELGTLSSLRGQLQEVEQRLAEDMVEYENSFNRMLEHEQKYVSLRTQLERSRQQRVVELGELFPVRTIDGSPRVAAGEAVYTICGHRLPTLSQTISPTAELMQEWSLALGCAAHLVVALAALYNCTVPHPLLVCGARSYVLKRPGLSVASVLSQGSGTVSDVRLPLHCTRAAERPLMNAAVLLLLSDVAAVGRIMESDATSSGAARAAAAPDGVKFLGKVLHGLLLWSRGGGGMK
uniref:Uncharacterized protein n=1 Tax=Trypanosoma congolense (strain IL3000) TaxID=1068625 RepID=G0UJI2_TRYCI|nr:conserved hypothetical protein [Trypanosoma congolense IL3000]